jgi:hypothetical protein
LKVDFDTGSTNLWIVDTCKALRNRNIFDYDYTCYDNQNSSSAVNLEMGSIIKFGKGSLIGNWGKDSLWIGEKEVPNQYMAFAD